MKEWVQAVLIRGLDLTAHLRCIFAITPPSAVSTTYTKPIYTTCTSMIRTLRGICITQRNALGIIVSKAFLVASPGPVTWEMSGGLGEYPSIHTCIYYDDNLFPLSRLRMGCEGSRNRAGGWRFLGHGLELALALGLGLGLGFVSGELKGDGCIFLRGGGGPGGVRGMRWAWSEGDRTGWDLCEMYERWGVDKVEG